VTQLLRLVTTLQHEMHGAAAAAAGAAQPDDFSLRTADHHAMAPQGGYEYVLVIIGVVVTVLLTIYTIKLLVKPGEVGPGHIKRKILTGDR